ncbi:thymidine phosphorylase, partial [Xanthomonas vasicola]
HIVGRPWLQVWQPALHRVFASVGLHGDAVVVAITALHDTLQAIAEARPELEKALPELPQVNLPPPAAESVSVVLGAEAVAQSIDSADAERFRAMDIGTWLDFVDKDGKVQAGKLSWVSPISQRLLFVNRRGVRFCVASPEELAVMVRLGRLREHINDGAFDSAMQGVIDRLDPLHNNTVH